MIQPKSPNNKPKPHATVQVQSRASAAQTRKDHIMGLAEAGWSSFTPTMAAIHSFMLAAGAHLHLGGQRLAFLGDII